MNNTSTAFISLN